MTDTIKTCLVLAPHPDDGEFGCGASIKKLVDNGIKVWYAALSPCTISVPKEFEKDILYKELKNATKILGINSDNIITFDFNVREFPKYRQDILEELIQLKKAIQPDLVLLPNSDDVHQDHRTIYEEGKRAFKHSRILGYELPWNSTKFISNFHIKVSKNHLEAKYQALQEYKSQKFRTYHSKDFIQGLARVRGVQTNSEYAEAFELVRWHLD